MKRACKNFTLEFDNTPGEFHELPLKIINTNE